ncbi:hypothetical protein J1N35_022331, partial [Gossypium stocksii]
NTFTPTTTINPPKSKAPMIKQEHKITMLDIDDADELPINQLQQKRFKKAIGKAVQENVGLITRLQRYKRATKKSTQSK